MADIIDAVENFSYHSLNSSYNEAYHQWRKDGPKYYRLRYRKPEGEKVHIEGLGKHPQSPLEREKITLTRISKTIGTALLLMLLCESLGTRLFSFISNLLGYPIQSDFMLFSIWGGQWSVITLKMVINTLKLLIPLVYLQYKFRFPKKMLFSFRCSSTMELPGALGLGFLAASVVSIFEFLSGSTFLDVENIYNLNGTKALLFYALFELLIGTLLSELLLRGLMLPILRQFGDFFAIGAVTLVAFLIPNTLPYRIGEGLLGICAGYICIRTGSTFYCWLLRFSYTTFLIGELILSSNNDSYTDPFFTLCFTCISFLALFVWIRFRRKVNTLENGKQFLPLSQKLISFFSTIPLFSWIGVVFILMVIQLCL